jgi:predicted DNA-binding transcriptional regulator YafY
VVRRGGAVAGATWVEATLPTAAGASLVLELLALGDAVEVLRPAWLRDELRAAAARVVARYA